MKSIRRNVFETNSSSTHSLTIEYGGSDGLSLTLPDNRGYELGYFDILRFPLTKDGIAEGQVEKLRIIVALISEFIYYELNDKFQKEWQEKHPNARYGWSYEYQAFRDKKSKLKGTRDYVLNHRFWKYLNSILKKRLNINIKIYGTSEWFPYVSEFVDSELGCESSKYYREIGLSSKMTRDDFIKKIEEIIFNNDIVIYQETSERY